MPELFFSSDFHYNSVPPEVLCSVALRAGCVKQDSAERLVLGPGLAFWSLVTASASPCLADERMRENAASRTTLPWTAAKEDLST